MNTMAQSTPLTVKVVGMKLAAALEEDARMRPMLTSEAALAGRRDSHVSLAVPVKVLLENSCICDGARRKGGDGRISDITIIRREVDGAATKR